MALISAEDYANLPAVAPDASFTYGSDASQFVDLYLPSTTGMHPVVVLVHGGCWREQYTLKPLGGICRALTDAGFAVWSIEYRRTGNGGGYPQTLLDVAQGADLICTVAAEYHLDLSHVITMGHSAGGHAALWLAARHRLAPTSPLYSTNPLAVRGVVCLAGIVDLVYGVEQNQCAGSLTFVLGGMPEEVPDHYRDASPMALLPIGVRQIHIVGDADDEMLDNVRPYIDAATKVGDDVRLVIPPNAGHFEIVVANTPAWKTVLDAVIELQT